MVGANDYITLYKNWIYYTSGRTPALSGTTLLHAVNNVWSSNVGGMIEGTTSTGRGLYEGNYFLNVPTIVDSGFAGKLFAAQSSNLASCATYLGRDCVANLQGSGSGAFTNSDTSFFSAFSGKSIAPASAASSIASSVVAGAGNTL